MPSGRATRAFAAIAAAVFATGLPLWEAPVDAAAADTTKTFVVSDGAKRPYTMHDPRPDPSSANAPIVFDFEGSLTPTFAALSDANGFVLLQTAAEGVVSRFTANQLFVNELMTYVLSPESGLNIDRSRVYLFGFSTGGAFIGKTVCAAGDAQLAQSIRSRIAGFGTVGSSLRTVDAMPYLRQVGQDAAGQPLGDTTTVNGAADCSARPPVPMISVTGLADAGFNARSCGSSAENPQPACVMSQTEYFVHWSRVNGCTGLPATIPLTIATATTSNVQFDAGGCPAGTGVRLIGVAGAGHTSTPARFNTPDAFWAFISQFRNGSAPVVLPPPVVTPPGSGGGGTGPGGTGTGGDGGATTGGGVAAAGGGDGGQVESDAEATTTSTVAPPADGQSAGSPDTTALAAAPGRRVGSRTSPATSGNGSGTRTWLIAAAGLGVVIAATALVRWRRRTPNG
jgi:poly(3-hydroxybutyrate) depolymerase